MIKSFKEISLPITEAEYRNDGCFHYSTLGTFSRTGFHGLSTLYDRKESPSLTFGSMVDTYLTDGEEAFNSLFAVADMPEISDKIASIVSDLYLQCHDIYPDLNMIPNAKIAEVCEKYEYQPKWGVESKAKHVRLDGGKVYYDLLSLKGDATLVSSKDYEDMLRCVDALRTHPLTSRLFCDDGNPEIERLFQLKFKAYAKLVNNDTEYVISTTPTDDPEMLPFSNMADLIYVDHENKIVIPIDLKTSSHYEDEFYKSFIDWWYSGQARQYWRLIRANMDADPIFKDYKLLDYLFVVVNRNSLKPLVWEFKDTQKVGTLIYAGKSKTFVLRDPFDLARELNMYQNNTFAHPAGITDDEPNDIVSYLLKE